MTTHDAAGPAALSIDDIFDEPKVDKQPELPEVTVVAEGVDPPVEKKEPEKPKDDPVARLTAQVEAARQRETTLIAERDRVAQIATQKAREAQAATARAQLSDYDLIANALAGATEKMGVLEQQYANAFAEGDGARAAALQRQMATLGPRIAQLEDGKSRMEDMAAHQKRQAEVQRRQPPQQQRPQQQHGDPLEASIAHFSEPSKKWIREHRDLVTQPGKWEAVIRAHHVAEDNGLEADTQDYFAFIEKKIGLRQEEPEPTPAAPRRSMPAAPVSRGNGNGGKPTPVRLSVEEQRIASDLGMTNEEYARGKVLRAKEQSQMRAH